MEDKLKQSEQARERLAKELVRTKISLECADNTIKKQQKNIDELEIENTRLQSMIAKIKDISENFIKGVSDEAVHYYPMYTVHTQILNLINESEEHNIE